MNKILLVGRLVRDPDVATTPSNIKYVRFTVAVDRPFSERQTDFLPIVAWRNDAEFVERYIRKGALVSVEGRLQSRTYQNAAGQTVTNYEISADAVRSLESRAQQEARTSGAATPPLNNTSLGPRAASSTTPPLQFENDKPETVVDDNSDAPWEIDL